MAQQTHLETMSGLRLLRNKLKNSKEWMEKKQNEYKKDDNYYWYYSGRLEDTRHFIKKLNEILS